MTFERLVEKLKLDLESFELIRAEADAIREKHFGKEVYIRGLIEFSNYCRCSCAYCGLRVENKNLERFRLSYEEILEIVKEGYEAGYRSFVLQSGEDLTYTVEGLGKLITDIKTIGDVAITLSIGERTKKEYETLRLKGVDRFLLKHECSEEAIYNKLHPHSPFVNRLRCLKDLKALDYQTGSGFMIGLPGQTEETIAKDIKLLEEVGVHMAGIGPFIAHDETPLKGSLSGSPAMTLKAVALTRIVLPHAMLPVTTSLGVVQEDMKAKCLAYGANVMMQKLEPVHLRKLYALYPKEVPSQKSIQEEKQQLESYLQKLGRKAVFHRGDYKG